MGDPQEVEDAERDVAMVRASVAELEPPLLRDRTFECLADRSMGAGRVVRHAAATVGGHAPKGPLDDRVVGVQLIYVGLGLIRELARGQPWAHDVKDTGDLDVLVAEVLVAKGFSLLASTAAAPKAVETVQTLARSETSRLNCAAHRTPLEASIFELGVEAGVSAIETVSDEDLENLAQRVATRVDATDEHHAIVFANRWRDPHIAADD